MFINSEIYNIVSELIWDIGIVRIAKRMYVVARIDAQNVVFQNPE